MYATILAAFGRLRNIILPITHSAAPNITMLNPVNNMVGLCIVFCVITSFSLFVFLLLASAAPPCPQFAMRLALTSRSHIHCSLSIELSSPEAPPSRSLREAVWFGRCFFGFFGLEYCVGILVLVVGLKLFLWRSLF
jgi:hypothetical protein